MSLIFFIDTETGGLNWKEHSLLSIGMVVYSDGDLIDKKHIFTKPDEYNTTKGALKTNRIDLENHKEMALPKEEVVEEYAGFIDEHIDKAYLDSVVYGGHNLIDFDMDFLKDYFEDSSYDFEGNMYKHPIDTLRILRLLAYAGVYDWSKLKLEKATSKLNIKLDNAHSAVPDAKASAEIYDRVTSQMHYKLEDAF